MNSFTRTSVHALLAGILVAATGSFSLAVDQDAKGFHPHNAAWRKDHPRQAEVLRRSRRERQRINADYKAGKITKAQRNQMMSQVRDVRREDMADNRANMNKNGVGYISKGQQGTMNQQENQVNRELRSDVNADKASAGTPPAAN